MKTTVALILTILISVTGYTQCAWGGSGKAADITAGVIIDGSLKQYEPTGFYGLGVSAGIWVNPCSPVIPTLGIFAGYIESKLNDKTPATGSMALTLTVSKAFINERLIVAGHFSHGTGNYQDIGLRVGYDIWDNGIAVGATVSRMMHYGITIMVSMKNSK
jgi:hypothetical protein